MTSTASNLYSRGIQLITFKGTRGFSSSVNAQGETIFVSKVLPTHIRWNELVVSWNVHMSSHAALKIEAKALDTTSGRQTGYYCLGLWSTNPEQYPRESVLNQTDSYGSVDTDTLILNERWNALQLRLTVTGTGKPGFEFIALSLLDNTAAPPPLEPFEKAWGKKLPVPEKTQMIYEGGNVLCSPTTVSMMLEYWADKLEQPALRIDVPEIKRAVYDRNWKGTGNWAFNMAYAGSLDGLRAYLVRLSDLRMVEELVNRGIPVGLSLCYNRLRGRTDRGPSGHLVVCVGFTETGDVVINDSGTRQNVQKVFSRERVLDAWAHSKNAAYLIYPEEYRLPKDKYGEFK